MLLESDDFCAKLNEEHNGNVRLLWAWVTHETDDEFMKWAKRDAFNNCDRAIERLGADGRLGRTFAHLAQKIPRRRTHRN